MIKESNSKFASQLESELGAAPVDMASGSDSNAICF